MLRLPFLAFGSLLGVALATGALGCSREAAVEGARAAAAPARIAPSPPRLVLWLTIDQLSIPAFERVARQRPGFFRRLRDEGRYYEGGRYRHANTETAPGHATLFTGTSPRVHGVVANEWWSERLGRIVPSTLDPRHALLPARAEDAEATGRSPAALRVPTFGDALRAKFGPASRVLSISLKDRGAILPAGRDGKAVWLASGRFTTSRYYYEELPPWFDASGFDGRLEELAAEEWTLVDPPESYEAKAKTPSPRAATYWGASFPHRASSSATRDEILRASPNGDRAVLELARLVADAEALGVDDVPDLLALSLSANDYVGHYFGPETLEAEDLLRRVDIELARFVSELEARVGQEGLLIVFSSDHGGSESPEASQALRGHGGFWTAVDVAGRAKAGLEAVRRAQNRANRGGVPELRAVVPPYVFLGRTDSGERVAPEVCEALAKELRARIDGLAEAFCTRALLETKERTALEESVFRALHPEVSGDLYLVFEERVQFLHETKMVATHGSPWDYDRQVPIALLGARVPSSTVREVAWVDALAPTVGRLTGVPFRGEEGLLLPGIQ